MRRPVSVTAFGVLNTTIGVLWLTYSGWACALYALRLYELSRIAGRTGVSRALLMSPARQALFTTCVMIAIGLGLALLASGVGLLKMRPWARTVAAAYGVLGTVACIGIQALVFWQRASHASVRGLLSEPAVSAFGYCCVVFGVVGVCHAILLRVFMDLPETQEAFDQEDAKRAAPVRSGDWRTHLDTRA